MRSPRFYLVIFLLASATALAQPGVGDPNGGGKPGSVPISGIEILLGIGGLFGVRKLLKRNSKSDV